MKIEYIDLGSSTVIFITSSIFSMHSHNLYVKKVLDSNPNCLIKRVGFLYKKTVIAM